MAFRLSYLSTAFVPGETVATNYFPDPFLQGGFPRADYFTTVSGFSSTGTEVSSEPFTWDESSTTGVLHLQRGAGISPFLPATSGQRVSLSATFDNQSNETLSVEAQVVFRTAANAIVVTTSWSPLVSDLSPGSQATTTNQFLAAGIGPTIASAQIVVRFVSQGAPPIGTAAVFSIACLVDPESVPEGPFSGDTPPRGENEFSWAGTPYRSPSLMSRLIESDQVANPINFTDFTVQEAATPLSAGDSSGQTGTISFSVPKVDVEMDPENPLAKYGISWLIGKRIRLDDSRKGYTIGTVSSARLNGRNGMIEVTSNSRLGELNVFNVQSPPFSGTLVEAISRYLNLAGVTGDFLVDPAIATQQVVLPGWNGELWYTLKEMMTALDCDISLVSGIILVRPIRARVATRGRDIDRMHTVGGGSLAQYVSVMQYNNRAINSELVYPPGGWSEDVTTININAGETIEEVIQLSASVSSITQPVMQTFVSQNHRTSSVFTVVGDDGLPVQPAQWSARGGRLRVSINPDTTSLTVTITAPTGIRNKDNKEIGVYGISLSSSSGTGRYSTLRILGTGVAFEKEEVRVATGVTERETATEVGVTIDNPFLSSKDQVMTAGIRATRSYNGSGMSITGTVSAINRRGDTGGVVLRTYGEFQTFHTGRTYAQVQTFYTGKTYSDAESEFNSGVEDSFENQVFGNVAGARVWDEESRRWYRIRNATLNPDTIQFDGEDDLLHSDMAEFLTGQTYDQVQLRYNGFSYREVDLMGMR